MASFLERFRATSPVGLAELKASFEQEQQKRENRQKVLNFLAEKGVINPSEFSTFQNELDATGNINFPAQLQRRIENPQAGVTGIPMQSVPLTFNPPPVKEKEKPKVEFFRDSEGNIQPLPDEIRGKFEPSQFLAQNVREPKPKVMFIRDKGKIIPLPEDIRGKFEPSQFLTVNEKEASEPKETPQEKIFRSQIETFQNALKEGFVTPELAQSTLPALDHFGLELATTGGEKIEPSAFKKFFGAEATVSPTKFFIRGKTSSTKSDSTEPDLKSQAVQILTSKGMPTTDSNITYIVDQLKKARSGK